MTETLYEFGFSSQLPRVFEVVNAIISVEPGAASHKTGQSESLSRLSVIHSAATKIRTLWVEAFSEEHVKTINAVKHQIRKSLENYSKFMKKGKSLTRREKLKSYRLQNSVLFECFAKNVNADYLANLENFQVEQDFYDDQVGPRLMYLDEEIDEEYEAIRTARLLQESKKNESLQAEMRHIFEDDDCADDSASSSHPASSSPAFDARSTRSGRILPSNDMVCEETQTDIHLVSQPPVPKVKVCTEEIKSALSEVSVVAQISPEKARIAAQAFARNFYQPN